MELPNEKGFREKLYSLLNKWRPPMSQEVINEISDAVIDLIKKE